MGNIYFSYPGGKAITYSFYWKVCNRVGKSHNETKRIFYRAKGATNPITWISKGLKDGYALTPCEDEYDNIPAVTAWIDKVINKIEPEKKPVFIDRKKAPDKLGDILKGVL